MDRPGMERPERLPRPEAHGSGRPGTCFAGFGRICDRTLTPDPRKAESLRTRKYW